MFCGKCGSENPNGARFCKECGQPLASGNHQANSSNQNSSISLGHHPRISGKILLIAGAAAVALILVIIFAMHFSKTIDLNQFVVVETEGYDGYGTASIHIDWEAFEDKYGEKLSFTKQAEKEFSFLLNFGTPIRLLQDNIRIELLESEGLSNGDEIQYVWEVDEELSAYINMKLTYKNDTYKIDDLEEMSSFDAFADLEVDFSGISPEGRAHLNYDGSELSSDDFLCDRTQGLRNGDKITIKLDEDGLSSLAKRHGKIPEVSEREYEVQGLKSYVEKLEEIDEETLASLREQGEDTYYASTAKWKSDETLETFTYIGNYLLYAKNTAQREIKNCLYLVYRAQVRHQYPYEPQDYNKVSDAYWYLRYDNLIMDANGAIEVDPMAYEIPDHTFKIEYRDPDDYYGYYKWVRRGYSTLDALYEGVVTASRDAYDCEANIDDSVAPVAVEKGQTGQKSDEKQKDQEEQKAEVTEKAAEKQEPNKQESDQQEESQKVKVEEEEETSKETFQAETKLDAGAGQNGYFFANSDRVLLTREDLKGLTAEECRIARNEICARHGRKFKDKELQAYFDACDWYEGTIEADDFKDTFLNDIENANQKFMIEYEEELKGR